MSDDPGFRRETMNTVEPTDAELAAHYRAERDGLAARVTELEAKDEALRRVRELCREGDGDDLIAVTADDALAASRPSEASS